MKKHKFTLKDLDCANCANKIQNKLSENNAYENVIVNFNTLRLTLESELEYEEVKANVVKVISELEPEVEVLDIDKEHEHHSHEEHNHETHEHHNHEGHKHEEHEHNNHKEHNHEVHEHNGESKNKKKLNFNILRLLIGILLMIVGVYITLPSYLNLVATILAYVVLLYRTAKNALKLLKKKIIDENFLVTISCIGAYFIGEQAEGLMVIVLYELGKILEDKAINNTRKSIASLMDIKPEYANLKHSNHEHKVSPEEVNIGDIIIVKQGEKVPLDGIVVSGSASLNTASLTGESKLSKVKENDKIISGSINEKGLIEVKVTEKYENSTVSRILELVENATDKKTKTETFVNKASRVYTPIVVGLAILVAVLLPLLPEIGFKESIYRALIFLVVSCPCAIVISVPLSYFTGIGRASKSGILIKGSNYLDALKDVKEIAFDKTGTLTKGEFGVEKIKAYSNYSEEEILEYAALAESFSNHPIAVAILKKYGKTVNKEKVEAFEEVSGKGLTYKINGKQVKIGNLEFAGNQKEEEIGTVIYVKMEEEVIGAIVLNDTLKPETKAAVEKLKNLGIVTKMFTGDNSEIALKVGKEIGINEVKAEMLPQDKYNELEKMITANKETKRRVAFVGDGINDSPVLALSDVGISMGGIGASSAIEASDVVIMTDDLSKIEEAIKISRKTNKIIKQNLLFALIIKVLVLILSVFGVAQMWQAVFADVGVTLITIVNTMRILKK